MRRQGATAILILIFLACVCLLYVGRHTRSPSTVRITPAERDSTGRTGAIPPESNNQGSAASESCRTLGVTCKSEYFAPWNWPENGSCRTTLSNGYPVPDKRCTPGGMVPDLSADVLRSRLWRTKCIRNCQSSEAEKHTVYDWYDLPKPIHNNGKNQVCELDHLVPIELGGADGLGNIWPQCGPNEVALHDRYFKRKDEVEGYLATKVRDGDMSLDEAQRGIASDWTQYLPAAERSESGRLARRIR